MSVLEILGYVVGGIFGLVSLLIVLLVVAGLIKRYIDPDLSTGGAMFAALLVVLFIGICMAAL